jgi:hypothetical protein
MLDPPWPLGSTGPNSTDAVAILKFSLAVRVRRGDSRCPRNRGFLVDFDPDLFTGSGFEDQDSDSVIQILDAEFRVMQLAHLDFLSCLALNFETQTTSPPTSF